MRTDAQEGGGLCLRPSPTTIGPAAYGHRLQPRQDFSGLLGRLHRRGRFCGRSAGGTCVYGGHEANTARPQAAADRSGAAQGDHGDLVCLLLRHAVAGDWPAVRHSVRHAVHPVRPLDPTWFVRSYVATATRPEWMMGWPQAALPRLG